MRSAFPLRLASLSLVIVLAACSSSASKSASETTLSESTTSSSTESSTTSSIDGDTTTTADSTTTAPAPSTTKAPAPTVAPTPAPTSPPASGPKITSFSITGPTSCPSTDVSVSLPPVPVKITWTATGADSVYIAIGNPDGPYESNLPLSGSYELPSPCPGPYSQTYYVVAVKGSQKDVKSKTLSSNS